jgi:hypothetical protein
MRCWSPIPPVLLAVGLTACAATMGSGVGSTPSGVERATFLWRSSGASTGQMTATLSNGEAFTGSYFQITRETRVDTLGPLWTGWGPRFGPWGYWGPTDQFLTQYTGRVVGNLEAADGSHMRCRFTLARPSLGMAGGGLGECQLPNGMTIDAMFPVT